MFSYKMVQVPRNIMVQSSKHRGNEASVYMQEVVDTHAIDGWEFYRVDPIGVNIQPGCLASLFGHKTIVHTYHVISFRKAK